ncbi:MAG: NHL repeat-containing protein [Coriobacteriia bacterium]|nr:NHL repeat-containing protein [Coriobacteriia bacterium]
MTDQFTTDDTSISDVESPYDVVDLSTEEETKPKNKAARAALIVAILILLLILVLLGGLLLNLVNPAGIATSDSAGVTWIRSIYGFGDTQEQQHYPNDVSIIPGTSRLLVADGQSMRVLEYGTNGVFNKMLTGSPIIYPTSVAASPDGTIYIGDVTYDRILMYTSSGTYINEIVIPNPRCIAVNSELLVVGVEGGFGAFTPQGVPIGYVGTYGTGQDQFDLVGGIALDSESNIYVTDTYNNRLSKYTKDGDLIWMVETGFPGNQAVDGSPTMNAEELIAKYPANLQTPTGVTIDGAGRVVVVDMLGFNFAVFSPDDGAFIEKYGEYGIEDGRFAYPSTISYSAAEDVFAVGEAARGRVQIIRIPDSGGNIVTQLRSALSGLLPACCCPILIILLLLALWWIITHFLRKRTREDKVIVEVDVDSLDQNEYIDVDDEIVEATDTIAEPEVEIIESTE